MEGSGSVGVTSEIGRLRRVICHEPGPELTVVTPGNRAAYLFDDLLDLEESRTEHRRFRTLLERFAEVREVSDLFRDVLEDDDTRERILGQADPGVRAWAEGADAEELTRLFVEGKRALLSGNRTGSLADLVHEAGYILPPLPNLFFTRDAACVVGDRVIVADMANGVRWTEGLIMHSLFAFHPLLANGGFVHDGTADRSLNTSIEGGDVHVLRPDLLLMGRSERTSAAGIDTLAATLFETTPIQDLLVVLMPRNRAAIHLDMIFTMVDRDLCCVFKPYFIGPTRLPIVHLSKDRDSVREMPDLFTALAELGVPVEPIPCGGERPAQQEREQWGSGCNMFAVGPGQLLAYGRNEHTLGAMVREGGFRVVDSVAFLTGEESLDEDERFVISFRGAELVRGGGGPRCMTLPVLREELA
jgi:arginine deiminase